ncbi:MAG: hypothetical protein GEU73_09605 [Chloroflexi bacterium]|nr:hypothetical protein [Chloroflexota bacterium]
MSRLNHLSIMCEDPYRLEQFYERWFGFEELNRTAGIVYITDGYFNVALMRRWAPDLAEADQ